MDLPKASAVTLRYRFSLDASMIDGKGGVEATAVVLAGQSDDFFGQYRHNSHVVFGIRYSF